jgi:hypothetical protein
MGKFYESIGDDHAKWILEQKLFFVATAPLDLQGTVNASPKGYDTLRIMGPNQVCYLDLTGERNFAFPLLAGVHHESPPLPLPTELNQVSYPLPLHP